MGEPFNRRTLLVRGSAAAGGIAGVAVLGLDPADAAGETTPAADPTPTGAAYGMIGGSIWPTQIWMS